MDSLRHYDWRAVYESQPSEDRAYLIEEFYQPALERCRQYDRIAGYFNSGSLAAASTGIEAFVENDATMRLIVGAQLQEMDRPVLEALEAEFEDRFTNPDDPQLEGRLEILAWLLHEDRLEIKVAKPKQGNWGVFHPKVGVFHDSDGNRLSFEGSINETKSGWTMNYERFKVHRSWRHEEAAYVAADVESFDQLWNNEHEYVDVYELSEAIEEGIIEWQSPDFDFDVDEAAKKARGEKPETDPEPAVADATPADYAGILRDGGLMPGGLQVADAASTIDPWPHQRVVSDTAMTTYPQGFLFCDEVGLGKTIEIGYTLSRLYHTEEIQNSLLLVPAGLTRQWQEELWEKFNLVSHRYDRQSTGEYGFVDPFGDVHLPPTQDEVRETVGDDEPWVESPIWRFVHERQNNDEPGLVVMSWHTARLSNYWPHVAPGDPETDQTRDNIPASTRGQSKQDREGVWDVVVVDEAHNARRTTNLYKLLEHVRPFTQTFYMLTATPMQLHHTELYDLLTLLGLPDAWDDRDRFAEFFQTRRTLRDALSETASETATRDVETQQTLDGEFQVGLDSSLTPSEEIYLRLTDQLRLESDAVARSRLLQACDLAKAYGDAYDGYIDTVDDALATADLDTFSGEERQLKELLYPEAALQNEPWIVGEKDRRVALDELSEDGWRVVSEVLNETTPVQALLHRNTRDTLRKYHEAGLLDETVATRKPERKNITLSADAEAVYDRIDEYTKTFYKKAQESEETKTRALGFVMTTYRERLTSSIAAIQHSLSRRLDTLEKQREAIERQTELEVEIDGPEAIQNFTEAEQMELAQLEDSGESMLGMDISEIVPGDTEEGLRLIKEEIAELRSFIGDVRKIELDPKIQQLRDDLRELDMQGHDRVLVFTQYTDTLDYVRNHLKQTHGENVATYSGRGGERYNADKDEWYGVSKEEVKRLFAADEGGIDVLVGTEAASEGLNLQECGAVINYDLPWNPMKVEQRIGRVDRIGQKHDEITIYHYVYENTVENDIYDALDERIGMFEDVVGELQPILAEVGQSIKSATLEGDESARGEVSSKMEQPADDETVEVHDALAEVDPTDAVTVMENARLSAWQADRHPDIREVGVEPDGKPPFALMGVESVFQERFFPTLETLSVTKVSELDNDFEVSEDEANRILLVSVPKDEMELTTPESGTLAAKLSTDENQMAITFDPSLADEYPSLRYALPGDPFFEQVTKTMLSRTTAELDRVTCGGRDRENDSCSFGVEPPVVHGKFVDEDERVVIDSHGGLSVIEQSRQDLVEWCQGFVSSRR